MRSRDARPNDVPGVPSPPITLEQIERALREIQTDEVELAHILGRWLTRWLRRQTQ